MNISRVTCNTKLDTLSNKIVSNYPNGGYFQRKLNVDSPILILWLELSHMLDFIFQIVFSNYE